MTGRIRTARQVAAWATATVLGLALAADFAQAGPPTQAAPATSGQARSHEPTASPRRTPSPRPSASARPSRSPKPKPSDRERGDERRRERAHRVLHGETVVATDNGIATHVVQRGVVTAVRGRTFTVRSSDGFTLTWTRDAETRVRDGRDDSRDRAIAGGDDVMVRGLRHDARTVVARLVRVDPDQGEQRRRSPSPAA